MTAEQINKHIDKFHDIYETPIPEGNKVTVYCDNGEDEVGFLENVTADEMGIQALIAQKWILQSNLENLVNS